MPERLVPNQFQDGTARIKDDRDRTTDGPLCLDSTLGLVCTFERLRTLARGGPAERGRHRSSSSKPAGRDTCQTTRDRPSDRPRSGELDRTEPAGPVGHTRSAPLARSRGDSRRGGGSEYDPRPVNRPRPRSPRGDHRQPRPHRDPSKRTRDLGSGRSGEAFPGHAESHLMAQRSPVHLPANAHWLEVT